MFLGVMIGLFIFLQHMFVTVEQMSKQKGLLLLIVVFFLDDL